MWVKKYPGQLQNENERFFQEIYFLPLEISEPIPKNPFLQVYFLRPSKW
jgi:hypothetical protein